MFKRLGQHFLINKNKIRKIIEVLELKDGDKVIEIGPGHGELTSNLKSQISNLKIIAIEKDGNLAKFLREKFSEDKNIEIIQGDALKEIKNQISKIKMTNQKFKIIQNLKIVGNIPYYITGYLFRILGELKNKPELIVLTIQKEVAERAAARPPKMNLLAASAQFWAEPEIIGYVSRKDFKPMPKVNSAIIKLRIKNYELGIKDNYYKLIKVLFKQPRKTILNNFLATSDKGQATRDKRQETRDKRREEIVKKLEKAGVNPQARPQDLSLEQIIKLSTLF
jgi:16S rRNA (adenine1518-N6/adenine1519-N6)-dimethyltransferase